jgi:hypothetical protein
MDTFGRISVMAVIGDMNVWLVKTRYCCHIYDKGSNSASRHDNIILNMLSKPARPWAARVSSFQKKDTWDWACR